MDGLFLSGISGLRDIFVKMLMVVAAQQDKIERWQEVSIRSETLSTGLSGVNLQETRYFLARTGGNMGARTRKKARAGTRPKKSHCEKALLER